MWLLSCEQIFCLLLNGITKLQYTTQRYTFVIPFKEARRYALVPMLDTIIKKISDWFIEHRKDAVSGSMDTKLVPLVEIHFLNLWGKTEKTPVRELNSYEPEYEVTDTDDGKNYAVNKTIYSVPNKSDWNVPDHIKELHIIPPDRLKRKGRKKDKRIPFVGERRKRTQNIRRPRQNFGFNWLLFGDHRFEYLSILSVLYFVKLWNTTSF